MMADALTAALWGVLASSSLVIGALLAMWLRPSTRIIGLIMGFGAGALLSALAYELVEEAISANGPVALGLTAGALTYFGGERAVPGYNVMGICKAALDSIVKYLAYDLGPQGVRVNALSPGPLQTVSGRGAGVDEMLGLYEAVAPLGRNVTHDEAGRCGAFLLSDMSSGITGELLHLDGGYNMMGSPGRMLEQIKAAKSGASA